MVSMGLGNKPFMDIQPSDAAISDRSVKKGAGNVASALPLFCPRTQTQAPGTHFGPQEAAQQAGWGVVTPRLTGLRGGTWSVSQMATLFSDLGSTWRASAKLTCFLSRSRATNPSIRGCAPL